VGGAFSNLVGETIAEHGGYTNAFLFLSLAALIPLLIYGIFMPSARHLSDGTAVDELSISQRSKYSSGPGSQDGSLHSKKGEGAGGAVTTTSTVLSSPTTKTEMMISNPLATNA
jgi:hypothetical protein